MSTRSIGPGKWLVRVRARIGGEVLSRTMTVDGNRIVARNEETRLIEELSRVREGAPKTGSLTLRTFGDALSYWTERTTAKLSTVQTLIDRMNRDLGGIRIDEIKERFGDFLDAMQTETGIRTGTRIGPATRNRYLEYAKTALNFAVKRGKLRENPLQGFEKEPEIERDRVLTPGEKLRLFKALLRRKSYLLMPVYFSTMNPIRKGDLSRLTRDNLNQFKPEVHFLPQKTGKRKARETHLVCLDRRILDWFKGLPADCPLLFPRIDSRGRWHALGDYKKEWAEVLRVAKVEDFHWHDLKHCAITFMLDAGFKELDLRNLGIQYSPKMIFRYYHEDPAKALETWRKIRESRGVVASVCGFQDQKVA